MPDTNVNLTVGDPVLVTVNNALQAFTAGCNATVSICNVLLSPEGQAGLKQATANAAAVQAVLGRGVDWIDAQVKALLGGIKVAVEGAQGHK